MIYLFTPIGVSPCGIARLICKELGLKEPYKKEKQYTKQYKNKEYTKKYTKLENERTRIKNNKKT
jgi:hypothetical protein